ncbi:hypothetical protein GGQ84_001768 [Desulfitispora alkaliphila]|uniref:DUF3786 domain-containing protein n=1 Tax=Desulfitispora alkaliphila TaxID=622674 RepID=UPI003D198CFE
MVRKYMWYSKVNFNNYKDAWEQALELFQGRTPEEISKSSGAQYDGMVLRLQSLGQELEVSYPSGQVYFRGTDKKPIFPWQLMTLNYLGRASGVELKNIPISYRELESGNVYFPALQRDAFIPFVKRIQKERADTVRNAFTYFSPESRNKGDISLVVWGFPRFSITITLWLADEEIDGNINVLFDKTANHYMHTEDVAVFVEMLFRFIRYEL